MANIVIILGKTGNGKSTSIKGLNPEETLVINVLNKTLPFKGCNKSYIKGVNVLNVSTHDNIIKILRAVNDDPKRQHFKNIIIDDAMHVMKKEFMDRAKEIGYTKFTELAQHFQQIIATCEQLKDDKNVFLMLHPDEIKSDNIIIGYKVNTIGQLLDTHYNPLEVVPMVLFSVAKFDDKGKPTFGFYTHKTLINGAEIPAKTPEGMFDEDFIPNDLGFVVDIMTKYFNEE